MTQPKQTTSLNMNSSNPLGNPSQDASNFNPLNPLAGPMPAAQKRVKKPRHVEEQLKPLQEGYKNSYIEKMCKCEAMIGEID